MKELSKEQIDQNKKIFLDLVDSIKIEGSDLVELKDYLLKSDFFLAPASTMYHAAYTGGLCEHSLNVYNTLIKLVKEYASHVELNPRWNHELGEEQDEPQYILVPNYSDDTLKVVALFHDLSKTNYYELYMRNVNTGEKDEKNKDIWIKVPEYKVKSGDNRFVAVNHEVNSYVILSRYIPLSEEELVAICNHHCCTGDGNTNRDLSYILDRYPLATLLHVADFLSCYCLERISND